MTRTAAKSLLNREDRIAVIKILAERGVSDSIIGEQLGVSANRIWTIRNQNQIESLAQTGRRPSKQPVEFIRALAGVGATQAQIGKMLDISEFVLARVYRDNGITGQRPGRRKAA
jgi:hypothetical protein